MKAWVVREKGMPWDVFELSEYPEPTHDAMKNYAIDIQGLRPRLEGEAPESNYVFIDVKAAGLAWPDVTMATGEYPVPVERPYVSGQEAVGVVYDAAPGHEHWIGKRVMGFTPQPWGCFAERCVVTTSTLYEAPERFSDEEAAVFVIASHTAYHAVHRRGGLCEGETVLVLGAAGGVPSAAVQLSVAAGARVVAVAGAREKTEFCRQLGADVVIDHHDGDFCDAVTEAVGPRSVDMIVDFVQGEQGAKARGLLDVEGRHVMAGHAAGLLPIHPNEFYLQNWTLVGCCMGSGYGERVPEIERQSHAALLELVESGRYRPLVGETIGFNEIPEAFRSFVDRKVMGRVVARLPDSTDG